MPKLIAGCQFARSVSARFLFLLFKFRSSDVAVQHELFDSRRSGETDGVSLVQYHKMDTDHRVLTFSP